MKETLQWVEITEKNKQEIIDSLGNDAEYTYETMHGNMIKKEGRFIKPLIFYVKEILLPIKQEVVTDEEIKSSAFKSADDWPHYSVVENAVSKASFINGAKWMRSRMTQQPKQEEEADLCKCDSDNICGICHKSKGYSIIAGKLTYIGAE